MSGSKWFRIWSGNRQDKCTLTGTSVDDVLSKASLKLASLKDISTDHLTLVMESCGSPIREDCVLNSMESGSLFIVLHHDEKWQAQGTHVTPKDVKSDKQSNLVEIAKRLKDIRQDHSKAKDTARPKSTARTTASTPKAETKPKHSDEPVRFHCGWQKVVLGRLVYQQGGTGGGPQQHSFARNSRYPEVLQAMKEAFLIPLEEGAYLSNYNGDMLDSQHFTAGSHYATLTKAKPRTLPRIYIVTGLCAMDDEPEITFKAPKRRKSSGAGKEVELDDTLPSVEFIHTTTSTTLGTVGGAVSSTPPLLPPSMSLGGGAVSSTPPLLPPSTTLGGGAVSSTPPLLPPSTTLGGGAVSSTPPLLPPSTTLGGGAVSSTPPLLPPSTTLGGGAVSSTPPLLPPSTSLGGECSTTAVQPTLTKSNGVHLASYSEAVVFEADIDHVKDILVAELFEENSPSSPDSSLNDVDTANYTPVALNGAPQALFRQMQLLEGTQIATKMFGKEEFMIIPNNLMARYFAFSNNCKGQGLVIIDDTLRFYLKNIAKWSQVQALGGVVWCLSPDTKDDFMTWRNSIKDSLRK